MTVKRMVGAYIDAVYFTDTGEPDQPDANARLSSEALDDIKEHCRSFMQRAGTYIHKNPEQAGHDLWLTTQGHGAGFWDGDWGGLGNILTDFADASGSLGDLYQGDDGYLYFA